jgi:broad specificity phosphatase PhoE
MTHDARRRMYLMRHGEVSYFADPATPVAPEQVAITERGVEQARSAGRALAEVRFDRVITSGLPRTMETARLVVEQLAQAPAQPEFEHWDDLQEFKAGSPDEIPDNDLEDAFLTVFRGTPAADASYVGGETVGSVTVRVAAAMERLYADPSWHTILLVLHGGINRAILSWALAGPGAFFAQFEQSFCCVNIIDGEPERFIIRTANLAAYDPAHLSSRLSTVELILEQYKGYRGI